MLVIGNAKTSAYSLSSQLGIPSGPAALRGFKDFNAFETEISVTVKKLDSSLTRLAESSEIRGGYAYIG